MKKLEFEMMKKAECDDEKDEWEYNKSIIIINLNQTIKRARLIKKRVS